MRNAGSYMTENLITVSPLLSTQELALLFEARRISGVPVVDDDGSVLGIVTKSDLSRSHGECMPTEEEACAWFHRRPEAGQDPRMQREDGGGLCRSGGPNPLDTLPRDLRVREVMNPSVFSIEADRSLKEVAREMLARRVHRLLVTRNGKLVGVVTSTDLLRAMAET